MEVVAKNRITGRTAQAITAVVNKSGRNVLFTKEGRTVNAGSLLGILSLVIVPGDTIMVRTDGDSEIIKEVQELL